MVDISSVDQQDNRSSSKRGTDIRVKEELLIRRKPNPREFSRQERNGKMFIKSTRMFRKIASLL